MRFVLALVAATLVVQASADAARQAVTRQAAGELTMISAKRAKAYSSPTRQIKVRNEKEDVVLVLRVGGIPKEAFQSIDRDTIYVMAGEEKLGPNVVASGIVDGKEEVLIVTVGPLALLDHTLHIGNYKPLAFKAEEAVADELH
jgi:hypothetical protein